MTDRGINVSVIVPCRNERSHIGRFLDDLDQQVDVPGDWEILIADGQSDDGTREVLEAYSTRQSRVRIIDNPERIVPTGLNRAIEAARGTYVVRLDVHSNYAPDYIATCIDVLKETGADNVGGPALTRTESQRQRAIAAAYASPFSVGNASFHFGDHEGPVDTVTYGCWRRQTLIDLGGFDPQLVRNQDDELNLRITRAGGTIWQSPRIRSWYRPRSRFRDLFRQYHQYGFWKVAVIKKHGRPAALRHLVPGVFLIGLLLSMLGGFFHPVIWGLGAFVLTLYVSFVGLGSALAAKKAGWKLWPEIAVAMVIFHMAYGTGFMRGWLHWRGNHRDDLMNQLSR